jgi:hypothetical protein
LGVEAGQHGSGSTYLQVSGDPLGKKLPGDLSGTAAFFVITA